jgi:site-specific DNA recombinase
MTTITTQSNKRAVIYVRVSTMEQVDEGNSLATQEKICREYAGKHGFVVPEDGVFIERGESAKTADRTQLQKMLQHCSTKKSGIVAVIVYKIDRLSRNTDDYSQLRILLKRYGVVIKSTSENIEDTPVGRFMENTMANIAQLDNDIRAERCSGGMREAVRSGRYVWCAPIGYSNVRVAGKATIAPNEMASLVRRAYELIASAAFSTDDVWRTMSRDGLLKKNGAPVSKTYFHELLRNEIYMGWMEKFGERHKGTFEPVVSENLFAQVQRVLKNKGHKVTQYRTDHPDFPLRRFVQNPMGLKLTGSFAKGKYSYYRFNGASGNYDRDELESRYADLMDSYRFDVRQIDTLKHLVKHKYHDSTESERRNASALESRLKELGDEQTTLIQKNLRGIVSDSILKQQLTRIEQEEIAIRSSLSLMTASDTSPEEAIAFASEYLEQPSAVWKKAGISTKLKLQWFQFPSGIVFDGKKFGTPEISGIFKAKQLISPRSKTLVDPRRFELLTPSLQMRCSTN